MSTSLGRQTVDIPTYKCVRCGRDLVQTGDINLDQTIDIFSRSCKMCKDTIFGVGTCWECNGCRYYYHETCLPPNPNLQHSFYPAVKYFKFLKDPGTAGKPKCDACYQRMEGCLYVGKNASPEHVQHVPSDIYMHPNCLVNLKASASSPTIEKHMKKILGLLQKNGGPVDYRLELNCKMSLSPGVECIFCNKRERGWVFTVGESSTKFECHVSCLREKLDQYCNKILNEHAAGSTYDAETYFRELSRWKLEGSARAVAGLAIPVAISCLDVLVTAVVGAPLLNILISFFLGMAGDKMKSKLGPLKKKNEE